MNAIDAIRRAVQQGMPCQHRGLTCAQLNCRNRRVRPVVAAKLIEAHGCGDWSWTRADAAVTDAFDGLDDNYTIGPYQVADYVKAIDGSLLADMRFTVTTATDRMLRRYA